jgi:hypothetical protein
MRLTISRRHYRGSETLAVINAQLDIRNSINSVIDTLEKYGAQMGLSGAALDRYVEQTDSPDAGILRTPMSRRSIAAIEAHKKAAIQLPGIWNDVFAKLSSGAKSWAASIFGVLDTIPGKFGDMARKVESTINTWVSFFDKILGLLSKFNSSIPSSIGDAIGKIVGIFKGGAKQSKDALGQLLDEISVVGIGASGGTAKVSNAVGSMTQKVSGYLKDAGAAFAGFAEGMSISMATGSKVIGAFAGAAMGALQGFLVGGPIGAIIGGIGGLLGGLLGGGKTAAQKEQERLNNEKLKADIAASAQATMNAALEGFQKALAFLDSLDQFTAPRKAKFQQFWKAMSRLMDGFVELAKKWQGENLEKDKAIAEAIGAVAQGIAAAPAALTQSTHPSRSPPLSLMFSLTISISS